MANLRIFFQRIEEYYGKPSKLPVQEYEKLLNEFSDDQLNSLAGDCIKHCERFPTVASVYKVIKEYGYKKPEPEKENTYSQFDMSFQEALKESQQWYDDTIRNKTKCYEKYKNAECVINAPLVFRNIIDLTYGKINESGHDYSKFNLGDTWIVLALAWQHKVVQNNFDRILQSKEPFKDYKLMDFEGVVGHKERETVYFE